MSASRASRRQPQVAVIGAGSWGTAVAAIVARNNKTVMWARSGEVAEQINERHVNERYLPEFALPHSLTATSDLQRVTERSDIIIMGVPSHGFRASLIDLAPYLRPWTPVVSLVKGLEQVTHRRMTEIIDEVLPGHPAGVLAGPNIAREVVAATPPPPSSPCRTCTSPLSSENCSAPSISASTRPATWSAWRSPAH